MKKAFVYLIALTFLPPALWAQTESAPQEAPFIKEDTEFQDYPVNNQDEADALAIEKEISNGQEPTVDLNSDVNSSQDLATELQADPVPSANQKEVSIRTKRQEPQSLAVQAPTDPNRNRKRFKKNGVEYIEHPLASKGLISIRKDGSYVYRTQEETKYTQSGVFRVGMMDPPRIVAKDGTTYEEMYKPGSQAVLFFDYEWQPFDKFGKWGFQFGAGLLMASGNGRYADPALAEEVPNETYNFFAVPINLGVVYRMEWMDRQWFAPYVSGGGTYVGVIEARDDGKTSMAGSPGFYGAGGLLLNISALDRQTAFTLNTEYGIKNLWVSLEYRYLKTVSSEIDFSSNIIGAGVAVDY